MNLIKDNDIFMVFYHVSPIIFLKAKRRIWLRTQAWKNSRAECILRLLTWDLPHGLCTHSTICNTRTKVGVMLATPTLAPCIAIVFAGAVSMLEHAQFGICGFRSGIIRPRDVEYLDCGYPSSPRMRSCVHVSAYITQTRNGKNRQPLITTQPCLRHALPPVIHYDWKMFCVITSNCCRYGVHI